MRLPTHTCLWFRSAHYDCVCAVHETMVGLKKVEAGTDLVAAKKRKLKGKKAPVKEEFEEWGGIED